jgi:hypothetical protein
MRSLQLLTFALLVTAANADPLVPKLIFTENAVGGAFDTANGCEAGGGCLEQDFTCGDDILIELIFIVTAPGWFEVTGSVTLVPVQSSNRWERFSVGRLQSQHSQIT